MSVVRIRIRVPGQASPAVSGTGFAVGPQHVLTAYHVVAGALAGEPVLVDWLDGTGKPLVSYTAEIVVSDPAQDQGKDWALLQLALPPDGTAAPAVTWFSVGDPQVVMRRPGPPAAFASSGFPQSMGGSAELQIDGVVLSPVGRPDDGAGPFQVRVEQLSAGAGVPFPGVSGAPVVVDGVAIGLLTEALQQGSLAVYGTAVATRIPVVWGAIARWMEQHLDAEDPAVERARAIRKWLLGLDPYFGLPGLPRTELPEQPFKALASYGEGDAGIFFGHEAELRTLYDHVTARSDTTPPIILLFGPSGAGKSSLLNAGLVPRLALTHEVRVARRSASGGLVGALAGVLDTADHTPAGLRAAWQAIETAGGRRLLVVIDQVEDVFLRGTPTGAELTALLDAVKPFLGDAAPPPHVGGRLLLAFRKEWWQEVDGAFRKARLAYRAASLPHLDRADVRGLLDRLTSDARLRDHYRIELVAAVLPRIVDAVTGDAGAAVGPMLQILLAGMWEGGYRARRDGKVVFDDARFDDANREGIAIRDYVERQLATTRAALVTVEGGDPVWVDSGLALQLLAWHATDLRTARLVLADDLGRHFAGDDDAARTRVDRLAKALDDARLLVTTDVARADGTNGTASRLVHDLVAPVVVDLLEKSAAPGARALRVLDYHRDAGSWQVSFRELRTVRKGLPFTRTLDDAEQKRLRRTSIALAVTAIAAVILLAVVGRLGYGLFEAKLQRTRDNAAAAAKMERAKREAELSRQRDRAVAAYQIVFRSLDPVERALAAGQAVAAAPDDDKRRTAYELGAIRLARGLGERIALLPKGALAYGVTKDDRFVSGSLDDGKTLQLWRIEGGEATPVPLAITAGCEPMETELDHQVLAALLRCASEVDVIAWQLPAGPTTRPLPALIQRPLAVAADTDLSSGLSLQILGDGAYLAVRLPAARGAKIKPVRVLRLLADATRPAQIEVAVTRDEWFDVAAEGAVLTTIEIRDGKQLVVQAPFDPRSVPRPLQQLGATEHFVDAHLSDDARWAAALVLVEHKPAPDGRKRATYALEVRVWDLNAPGEPPRSSVVHEFDPDELRLAGMFGLGSIDAISTDGARLAWHSGEGSVNIVDLPAKSADARTFAISCSVISSGKSHEMVIGWAADPDLAYVLCQRRFARTEAFALLRATPECASDPDLSGCVSKSQLAATARPTLLHFDVTDPTVGVLGYVDGDAIYRLRFRRREQQDLPGLPNGQGLDATATPDGFLVTRTTMIFKSPAGAAGVVDTTQTAVTERFDDANRELWNLSGFSPLNTTIELDESGQKMLILGRVADCSKTALTLSIWNARAPRLEDCLATVTLTNMFEPPTLGLLDGNALLIGQQPGGYAIHAFASDGDPKTKPTKTSHATAAFPAGQALYLLARSGRLAVTSEGSVLRVYQIAIEKGPPLKVSLTAIGPAMTFATDEETGLFSAALRQATAVRADGARALVVVLPRGELRIDVPEAEPARIYVRGERANLVADPMAPVVEIIGDGALVLRASTSDIDGVTRRVLCVHDTLLGGNLGCTSDGLGAPSIVAHRLLDGGEVLRLLTPSGQIIDWPIGASGRSRPWAQYLATARSGFTQHDAGSPVSAMSAADLLALRSRVADALCAARDGGDRFAEDLLAELDFAEVRKMRGGALCLQTR